MSAIINMNVKVDVASKENVVRRKINALSLALKIQIVHILIAVEMDTV